MTTSFFGHKVTAVFGAAMVVGFGLVNPAFAQYNAAADFDAAHNPSSKNGGVWEYGYESALGSGFGLDTVAGVTDGLNYWIGSSQYPGIEYNGTNAPIIVGGETWAPGVLSIHDGLGGGGIPNYGIVRFTAPTAGVYTIAGSFGPGDLNGSTQNFILSNGSSIFSATRTGNNSDFFNQSVSLQAGGTIDFVVGGAFNSGDTQLAATVIKSSAASAPEPGSLALLLTLVLPPAFALYAAARGLPDESRTNQPHLALAAYRAISRASRFAEIFSFCSPIKKPNRLPVERSDMRKSQMTKSRRFHPSKPKRGRESLQRNAVRLGASTAAALAPLFLVHPALAQNWVGTGRTPTGTLAATGVRDRLRIRRAPM